mgnify:CR=1 FL=1
MVQFEDKVDSRQAPFLMEIDRIENIAAERYVAKNNINKNPNEMNTGGLRALVEPVYQHTLFSDPEDIRLQKLATKADIRIINGIWFVRNEPRGDETNWPGIPVWSDHHGPSKYRIVRENRL